MPEHCERKFVVHLLETNSGGADYPARVVDVSHCPFCGQRLVAEPVSPAPKSATLRSKRGQGAGWEAE